jgi:hypothetical protein
MAAGPTKWTKLVDFLKNTYPAIMQGVVARKEEKVGGIARAGPVVSQQTVAVGGLGQLCQE